MRYPGDEFSRKEVRQCSSVKLIGVRLGEAELGLCRVLIYRAERGCYHKHSARPEVSLCWTRDLFNGDKGRWLDVRSVVLVEIAKAVKQCKACVSGGVVPE